MSTDKPGELSATKIALVLSVVFLLCNCMSTAPRQLMPTISLSPDNVLLDANNGDARIPGVSFGLTAGLNESDSLSNLSILPGIRVRAVAVGGPAERAGIRAGDVILSIDGAASNQPDMLDALAIQTQQERSFQFEVRRNTTVFEANVNVRPVIENQVSPIELYRTDPLLLRAGFTTEWLETRGQQTISGARLVRVFEHSPLPVAGIHADDVILAVNGVAVSSAQGLVNIINQSHKPGERVSLSVSRNNTIREVPVRLWESGRRLSVLRVWPLFSWESELDPRRTRLRVGDMILFSLMTFESNGPERSFSVLGLIRASSGLGELAEE